MIKLGEKKILTTKFSLSEMGAIENLAEARKFFILRWFVPMVYTVWQETNFPEQWALLHIARINGFYWPIITLTREEHSRIIINTIPISSITRTIPYSDICKRVCGLELYQDDMSAQLNRAFNECFSVKDIHTTTDTVPLIAAISKTSRIGVSASTEYDVKLNIVTKIRSQVKSDLALRNQIHSEKSDDLYSLSPKYRRNYNVLTGEWNHICDDAACKECSFIKDSVAKENAYDDPETA